MPKFRIETIETFKVRCVYRDVEAMTERDARWLVKDGKVAYDSHEILDSPPTSFKFQECEQESGATAEWAEAFIALYKAKFGLSVYASGILPDLLDAHFAVGLTPEQAVDKEMSRYSSPTDSKAHE